MGGQELMSYELQNFVLGMAQAMPDIRGLDRLGAIARGGDRVGVYGMSLGAYVAVAAGDARAGRPEFVLAGAPLCDIPELFKHHSTATLRQSRRPGRDASARRAKVVHAVISPLARPPLVPTERLAIFAGLGDRMAPPAQAQRLWEHWGQPRIAWYEGSHLTFLWSAAGAAVRRRDAAPRRASSAGAHARRELRQPGLAPERTHRIRVQPVREVAEGQPRVRVRPRHLAAHAPGAERARPDAVAEPSQDGVPVVAGDPQPEGPVRRDPDPRVDEAVAHDARSRRASTSGSHTPAASRRSAWK